MAVDRSRGDLPDQWDALVRRLVHGAKLAALRFFAQGWVGLFPPGGQAGHARENLIMYELVRSYARLCAYITYARIFT